MNQTILVIAILAAVAVAALSWLRWHAGRSRIDSLTDSGAAMPTIGKRDLMKSISGLNLTQVGHSRRIDDDIIRTDRILLFGYICETGLEHERRSHRWRVAMCNLEHGCSRATFTSQEWLLAASQRPALSRVTINGDRGDHRLVALVEDADEWRRRLDSGLGDWLTRCAADCNWEILPGMVVAYESGRFERAAQVKLRDSLEEMCARLGGGAGAAHSNTPS